MAVFEDDGPFQRIIYMFSRFQPLVFTVVWLYDEHCWRPQQESRAHKLFKDFRSGCWTYMFLMLQTFPMLNFFYICAIGSKLPLFPYHRGWETQPNSVGVYRAPWNKDSVIKGQQNATTLTMAHMKSIQKENFGRFKGLMVPWCHPVPPRPACFVGLLWFPW